MKKLITRAKIAQFKQISKTIHDDKLNELIIDAQLQDLEPLVGGKMFTKLMSDTEPDYYATLMAGGTYTYQGTTYTNYGLDAVLSSFVYARLKMFGDDINTPFGNVQKLNDNSQPTSDSLRKAMYTMNQNGALRLWESVRNWLTRTENEDFNNCASVPRRQFRITKL